MTFKDRVDAGRLLAFSLSRHLPTNRENVVVVGLPRGGVVVADTIAQSLKLPLDVMVVKKIGHFANPEFAVGAVGKQEIFLNPDAPADPDYVRAAAQSSRREIERQEKLYRQGRKPLGAEGKVVVLVDDGIATGLTVRVAIAQLRSQKVHKIILAAPVAAGDSLAQLAHEVDDVVCLYTPSFFMAVGQFYENFEEVSEREVARIIKSSARRPS